MKQKVIYLTFIISVVFGLLTVGFADAAGQPAGQVGESLDTTLARAAANSFLTALTRPELAETANFYLLGQLQSDHILAQLQDPAVTSFAVTGAGWISEVTYQVKATLQPGEREIVVYTGKYEGRWLVEGIDLPSGVMSDAPANSGQATTPVTLAGLQPVVENGTGKLVFQTQSGGDIYMINADGTGLRRLTAGLDPQLSPDGRQVAFTRWEPQYELFTINLDGTGERSWSQGWRQMKSPTWSADGSSLVFSFQSGGRLEEENHRIDLAAAAQNEDGIHVPSYARDVEVENGLLEYRIPMDAHWHLKQLNLATNTLTDLGTERHSYGPTGHPRQANLVIYKGQHGIALHNVETGLDQPVTTDFRDHTPVISPDGSRVAVSYWQDGHWEIQTLNIDGSNRQRLTDTPLNVLAERTELNKALVEGKERVVAGENPYWNNAAPVWSPDGSKIAFLTDRAGQWEIWLMNADGSNQGPMFSNGALAGLTLNYAGVDERMLSWR